MSGPDDTALHASEQNAPFAAFEGERPIFAALANVLFDRSVALVRDGPLTVERLQVIVAEIKELCEWIAPPHRETESENKEILTSWLKTFANAGCPPEKIVELADSLPARIRRKPGRPVADTREMATRFLDAQAKDAKLSYVRFMNGNCKCGKQRHTSCGAALRQQVIRLKDTLKKYGIPYPPTQST